MTARLIGASAAFLTLVWAAATEPGGRVSWQEVLWWTLIGAVGGGAYGMVFFQ